MLAHVDKTTTKIKISQLCAGVFGGSCKRSGGAGGFKIRIRADFELGSFAGQNST
jgi:hypothetical protein